MNEEYEIIKKVVIRLKKENTRSANKMIKQGAINWDIDKVVRLVDIYLDAVLKLYEKEKNIRRLTG